MIERLLFTAIKESLTEALANPALVVEYFVDEALLSLEEATKIKNDFVAQPPNIIHGYPRSDSAFPLYAITLNSDAPGQAFLGDDGGMEDNGDDIYARIRQFSFAVMVYSRHPDTTLYYYHLLQTFLVSSLSVLKGQGLFDISFSGADMGPDPSTAPAGLWVRRCSVTCSREYTQTQLGTRIGRAWQVGGIHVDSAGAPGRDVGGVNTNVTTYSEGDESDDEEAE